MAKETKILIKDFNLFTDVVKTTGKIVDSAKFIVDQNGMSIYGVKNQTARCEITSNSIYSSDPIEFSILDLGMLSKVLNTIREVHQDDYTDFSFVVDHPFIRFRSKKFKTKMTTCNEDVISKWISTKIKTEMQPVFEFTTTSDMVKRINNHSFIFSDPSSLRVYLETKDDMENNTLFATIGNKDTDLNNEMTLKFGLVTLGSLKDRNLILDLERLNLFNALPAKDIRVALMNMNVLLSKVKITGKNDTYFNLNVYTTILKS